MEKKLILVLGGARSGKSLFAERLAGQIGCDVLYIATATADDDEMRRRIEEHRRRRPATWQTVEAPLNVSAAIRANSERHHVVLIDCLSVLVSNMLLEHEKADEDVVAASARVEEAVRREMDKLLACYEDSTATFVVVSNEVGHGVVPAYPLGRVYRDVLGLANQLVARNADEVYLLVAGVPIELKALSRISLQGADWGPR